MTWQGRIVMPPWFTHVDLFIAMIPNAVHDSKLDLPLIKVNLRSAWQTDFSSTGYFGNTL